MKNKKLLTKLLIASLIGTNTLTISATSKPENIAMLSISNNQNYLKFQNNQFIIDKLAMQNAGYSIEEIESTYNFYFEINTMLTNENTPELQYEKDKMIAELGATEKGKLSSAVKVIKKFLKKNWPKIIKKLPAPVKKILTAEAILSVIDTYVGISDSVEELLTNCINAILPSPLEIFTPGIVSIIMLFLPL